MPLIDAITASSHAGREEAVAGAATCGADVVSAALSAAGAASVCTFSVRGSVDPVGVVVAFVAVLCGLSISSGSKDVVSEKDDSSIGE